MERCGNVKYFGADGPEGENELDQNGNPTFWRAHYPGSPFRNLERDSSGDLLGVCTPSIEGGALQTIQSSFKLIFVSMLFICLLLWHPLFYSV